jgi:hypothetical protein
MRTTTRHHVTHQRGAHGRRYGLSVLRKFLTMEIALGRRPAALARIVYLMHRSTAPSPFFQ